MKRILRQFVVALVLPAAASAQVLTFEGIVPAGAQNAPIGNYYNGGAGPNYGISFSPNALAGCLKPRANCTNNGSRGGLGDPNSANGVLFWIGGPSTYMNSAAGFVDGFSFFYSAPGTFENPLGSFSVWSGMNGTGVLLASLALGLTNDGAGTPGCLGTNFCPLTAAGITFAGTARSVTFGGKADQIIFDDVTFGSSQPGTVVPEPASVTLIGTGLLGIVGIAWRKRRKATRGMGVEPAR